MSSPSLSICTRCGTPLGPLDLACGSCGLDVRFGFFDGPEPGTLIAGRYELAEQVGAGGMGRVYRAIHHPLGTEVCIKTLHEDVTGQTHFEARFLREAQALARLQHPNIVSVLDFGTDEEGTTFLVMEYVAGTNLARISRAEKTLPAARAVRILGQVCDALTAAHAAEVIHRDLKPSNIMVQDLPDQPDFVKVLDFGSALIQGSQSDRLTQVGSVIGTPVYMAPEYILGRSIDARVDVYSVGVLLYLLLSGTAPFRGVTQAVFAQHVSQRPEPPRERNPEADISPAMERVVLRALEKDPTLRFQTAASLKAAMVGALEATFEPERDVSVVIDGVGRGDDTAKETPGGRQHLSFTGTAAAALPLAPEPVEEASDVEADTATDAHAPRPEVAAADRPATAVAVVRGAYDMEKGTLEQIAALGVARGGAVDARRASVALAFGLEGGSGRTAVAAALGWAADAISGAPDRSLRAGVDETAPPLPSSIGSRLRVADAAAARDVAETLAASARPGQILVTDRAVHLAGPRPRRTAVRPPPGFERPVFDVGAGPPASPHALPFGGRERALEALIGLVATSGQGRVAYIFGPEGIGKSRLLDEVGAALAGGPVELLVVRAAPRAPLGPEHAVAQVAALGWAPEDEAPAQGAALVSDLLRGAPLATGADQTGALFQERILAAVVVQVERRRARGPVTIAFDDLHFADRLTWALVDRLASAAADLGIGVVVSAREERQLPIADPPGTEVVALDPLTDDEMASAFEAALGVGLASARHARAADAAPGRPLLGGVVCRAVAAGRGSLLGRIAGLDPGAAVDELVGVRIEEVSTPALRLLCATALLGFAPAEEELLDVVGLSEANMAALVELESAGLVERDGWGRVRLPFPRMRRVALATLSRRERRELHELSAVAISASERARERLVDIGEHSLSAGRYEDALQSLVEASKAAESHGEVELALRCLKLAAEACRQLGDQVLQVRLGIYRDRGRLHLELGQIDRADRILKAGLRRARSRGAVRAAAEMLRLHGLVAARAGEVERGSRRIESAIRLARRRGLPALAAQACIDLAEVAEGGGDVDRALDMLAFGLDLLEGTSDHAATAAELEILKHLGRLELDARHLETAVAYFERALELAEASSNRGEAAVLLGYLGSALARLGALDKAAEATARALAASEALFDLNGAARQRYNLALIRLSTGKADAARELLYESREAAVRAGWRAGIPMCDEALEGLEQGHVR